jgi:ATP-dependent helicase/DNAse subunit B
MTLDDTLPNSQYLVGVKLSKENKFSYPQRVFSHEDNERFLETTLNHINIAVKAIRASEFSINPRQIGKDYSCSYCPFRDMCFRPNHAVEKIYLESEDTDDEPDLE